MKKFKQYSPIIIALVMILFGAGIYLSIAYAEKRASQPVVFSQNAMSVELWNSYKKNTIEEGTYRTVDRSQDNITTSEGQSYTMLRAVWMDDRDTFDKSWQWTKQNIQRKDSLFSWKYGPLADGNYGIQTDKGGQNTATDGDSDIALSLLMAYSRWDEPRYLDNAKPIIRSICEKEVASIGGKPVLMANDLEKKSTLDAVVNVSYFSPYAYKIFAKVDQSCDWNAVSDSSYDIINRAVKSNIDKSSTANLPPDWIVMDRKSGEIKPPTGNNTTNYSYDAIRTPWRLALDYQWFKDPRAKASLAQFSHLSGEWKKHSRLDAGYSHDGVSIANYESAAMYGASIGYFIVQDPSIAKEIYTTKLQKVYDADNQSSIEGLSYYDANWSWFGIAMYQNALPNLTEKVK